MRAGARVSSSPLSARAQRPRGTPVACLPGAGLPCSAACLWACASNSAWSAWGRGAAGRDKEGRPRMMVVSEEREGAGAPKPKSRESDDEHALRWPMEMGGYDITTARSTSRWRGCMRVGSLADPCSIGITNNHTRTGQRTSLQAAERPPLPPARATSQHGGRPSIAGQVRAAMRAS